MSNKFKYTDTENRTYYFFNDIVDIKAILKNIKTILKLVKSHTKKSFFNTLNVWRSKIEHTQKLIVPILSIIFLAKWMDTVKKLMEVNI